MTFQEIEKIAMKQFADSMRRLEDWLYKPVKEYNGHGLYDVWDKEKEE